MFPFFCACALPQEVKTKYSSVSTQAQGLANKINGFREPYTWTVFKIAKVWMILLVLVFDSNFVFTWWLAFLLALVLLMKPGFTAFTLHPPLAHFSGKQILEIKQITFIELWRSMTSSVCVLLSTIKTGWRVWKKFDRYSVRVALYGLQRNSITVTAWWQSTRNDWFDAMLGMGDEELLSKRNI